MGTRFSSEVCVWMDTGGSAPEGLGVGWHSGRIGLSELSRQKIGGCSQPSSREVVLFFSQVGLLVKDVVSGFWSRTGRKDGGGFSGGVALSLFLSRPPVRRRAEWRWVRKDEETVGNGRGRGTGKDVLFVCFWV